MDIGLAGGALDYLINGPILLKIGVLIRGLIKTSTD
jgi:hypothetical protein